ncbi:DUF262 domain-containing protein [Sphingobacterium sp.]|uniref:DUF262 domain-containing protein n=1 Tax=Sphingobacterium sp. TaxID=341027 RepID=UPI00289D9066|nr:DUF262 domain-containing protein [Sphingobacterium sp.]
MSNKQLLLTQIDGKRTEFKSEGYPMSIGELVNLYERKEILINPDFQRFFRWTDVQKTKLIESILLGIPVPSIFVFQREDGIWELVDGLQRVSTLLQFMGKLPNKQALTLQGTKYLPALEGTIWGQDDQPEDEADNVLPNSLKLHIKRAKLNFTIILSDTGKNAKYEVFQRLNTGGTYASDQEVRNSLMIMINKPTFTWFNEIANISNFIETISLSDKLIEEQYPMELALRHIALLYYDYSPKIELSDFFNEVVEVILTESAFPYEEYRDKFEKTFALLADLAGDEVFKRYDGTKFKGKFLESAFEAISVGISHNYDSYSLPADNEVLLAKIKELHTQVEFTRYTGSGSNARTRIPKIIPFAIEYFKV